MKSNLTKAQRAYLRQRAKEESLGLYVAEIYWLMNNPEVLELVAPALVASLRRFMQAVAGEEPATY